MPCRNVYGQNRQQPVNTGTRHRISGPAQASYAKRVFLKTRRTRNHPLLTFPRPSGAWKRLIEAGETSREYRNHKGGDDKRDTVFGAKMSRRSMGRHPEMLAPNSMTRGVALRNAICRKDVKRNPYPKEENE